MISPAKHFVMPEKKIEDAIQKIEKEKIEQIHKFEKENKLLEAQRIKMRTEYDLEMFKELGIVTELKIIRDIYQEEELGNVLIAC